MLATYHALTDPVGAALDLYPAATGSRTELQVDPSFVRKWIRFRAPLKRSADSELPYAPTACPPRDESSSSLGSLLAKPVVQPANVSDVLCAADEPPGDELDFDAGDMANQAQPSELAIVEEIKPPCASEEREATTVRQLRQQIGYGGTLIMESGPLNAPAARQSVRQMPENDTQTLVVTGIDGAQPMLGASAGQISPWAEFFASTPIPKRQHTMAIGIFMLVAAFLAFVIVLH